MNLWLVIVGVLMTCYVVIAIVVRPSVAIGSILPIAWIVPVWCGVDTGIDFLDVKMTVAIGMLSLYSFFPRAGFPWRMVPCDFAVVALTIVHVLSDWWNSGVQFMTPILAYAEWIVPYLAGRLAFQNRDDIKWAWPSLAVVAIVLTAATMFEAVAGMNPYEWGFGLRPLDGTPRNAERWNFRRAYGTCLHPLYQGAFLCWLFAWLVHPAWRVVNRHSNPIWLLGPMVGIFGPLATGSRGPFLGNFIIILSAVFIAKRRLRGAMTVTMVGLALLAAFNQNRIFELLDDWSGEFERGRQAASVTFDERSEKLSSARARLTLFSIYREPLMKAGALGFGTEAVETFPVNVPIGSDEAEAARAVSSVDNAYLLMTLRFGYFGLLAYVAMIATALWQLIRVHDAEPRRSQSIFAASLAAGTFALAVLVFGVWMSPDFGFAWLWGIGASSGMYFQTRPVLKWQRELAEHDGR